MEITTYGVIPLQSDLGIIEFVPKTMPLKNFLQTVPGADETIHNSNQKYMSGLAAITGKSIKDTFGIFYNVWKADNKKIINNYHAAVNQSDKYILKTALQNLSSCSEGFFILRRNFIRSYAVISAMQWILGRILASTLISLCKDFYE